MSVLVFVEGAADVVGVEADLRRQLGELVDVSDVTPFDEVGAQQALLGLELLAVLLGVVEQLVGLDGVRVLERREVVIEPDRASDRSHRSQHLLDLGRSEEHTSELQSRMRISYAVLRLEKKRSHSTNHRQTHTA